jgi:Ran GTPase-activating protein (RanGAP) involved in mRNA processing and transport
VLTKKLKCLGLPNSQITGSAMGMLCKEIGSKKNLCALVALNLSATFLNPRQLLQLSEALKFNRSLVKLDLSSNGLDSTCGMYIVNAIPSNFALTHLNLANNELLDVFVSEMLEKLNWKRTKKNFVLYEMDLSGNPFSTLAANKISKAISKNKIRIESFGSLEANGYVDITVRENLKGMLRGNDFTYPLLRPLNETNPDF